MSAASFLSIAGAGMFLTLPSHAMADPDDDTTASATTSAPATSGSAAPSYNPYASSSAPKPKPSASEDEDGSEPNDEDEDAPAHSASPAAPTSSSAGAPEVPTVAKPTNPAQVKAAACTFSREVTAQVAKDTKQFNDLAAVENASWADDDLAAAGEGARAGYQTALDKIRSTVPTSGFPSDIVAALTDLAHAADDWIYLIDNQNGDMIQGAISEYNDAVGRLRTACE
ncbi:hypothetical protein [Segniliparus rugosus]|uniref:hypothetical protein n=1 Tax=Segniliparus rugosus TaxID=286804 RepID=UPI0002EDCD04|nr:hypothetical protein [Segniliparus rugosus]